MDTTLRNASVVLAGGACIALVLNGLFSTFSGLVPVRGFWLAIQWAVPLLCLWCGMLVHYRIGRPRLWILVPLGLLAAAALYFSRHTVNGPGLYRQCYGFGFQFLLGVLLPWDHIRENGDRTGAKSAVLFAITALSYAALFLVWHRLGFVMKPEFADMETFLLVVLTNVLPFAAIPPLVFAVEFSFSKAGQWLGSRKWFFWVALPFAAFSFFIMMAALPPYFSLNYSFSASRWIRFLVQPVTVCLLVVLWRIVRSIGKGGIVWKEVFKL